MKEADNRVRWRCRRGLLELDLVLQRFLQQEHAGLSPAQAAAFAAIVELQDHDLWALVTQETRVTQEGQDMENPGTQVLAMLRRALRREDVIGRV